MDSTAEEVVGKEDGLVLDGQSGFGIILVTICFFQCLHRVLQYLPIPTAVTALANTNQSLFREFRWRNLLVSYIHATITGLWACFCVYHHWSYFWQDMLNNVNWCMYTVTCFATGYFIYDTLDILIAKRLVEKWEILVHHCAIVWCALYVVLQVSCVGYFVSAMVIEVNTAFLHGRKLLQMAAVPRTNWFLRINRFLNLITFVICRFGPLLILTYGIFREGLHLPFWFIFGYFLSVITLNVVNGVLFWRLLKADLWPILYPMEAETNVFQRKHRKIDSTAGMCGSMNIQQDCAGGDCNVASRIPSSIDLSTALTVDNEPLSRGTIKKRVADKMPEMGRRELRSQMKQPSLFKLGEEHDEGDSESDRSKSESEGSNELMKRKIHY